MVDGPNQFLNSPYGFAAIVGELMVKVHAHFVSVLDRFPEAFEVGDIVFSKAVTDRYTPAR